MSDLNLQQFRVQTNWVVLGIAVSVYGLSSPIRTAGCRPLRLRLTRRPDWRPCVPAAADLARSAAGPVCATLQRSPPMPLCPSLNTALDSGGGGKEEQEARSGQIRPARLGWSWRRAATAAAFVMAS